MKNRLGFIRHCGTVATVVFACTACSPDSNRNAAASPTPVEQAPAATPSDPVPPEPKSSEAVAVVPPGIVLPFDYRVLSNRLKTRTDGKQRRRTVLEVRQVELDTLSSSVDGVMTTAGFVQTARNAGDAGRFTVQYRKKGAGLVYVGFNPNASEKASADVTPKGPAVQVAFDWEPPSGVTKD